MKNWEVNLYRKDEALHVHLHGQRQIARGRNPSLSFKGILNPREAYKRTTAEVASRENLMDPLVISYEHQLWLMRIHTGEEHRRVLLRLPKSKRNRPVSLV